MAIGANVVWEIRTTATAANVNGGGFDPTSAGTDYSQQDASQYNFADLASTNATTAGGATVTSASHNFVTADEGNIINITAGTSWTVGRYKIVSTSANAATLDRNCGSVASITGGTYRVGGALSLANANDQATLTAIAAGNTAWIKSGTYQLVVSLTSGTSGTSTKNTLLTGYTTTRGDTCNGTSRPVIALDTATGTSSTTFPSYWRFTNIEISGTGVNNSGFISGAGSSFINCRLVNKGSVAALNGGANMKVINSEVYSNGGNGISATSDSVIHGCTIHGCGTGVALTSTGNLVMNNIFFGFLTQAVSTSGADGYFVGNTFYGLEGKTAVGCTVSGLGGAILNNIFYGLTTGISHSVANQTGYFENFNTYFNNTTDVTNFTKGLDTIALDPTFTSVTNKTGSAATTLAFVLTDGAADFSAVVDNQTYCRLVGGTNAGYHKITAHTGTTLTLDKSIGTTSGRTYQVILGKDFSVGTNMRAKGFPGDFTFLATGYMDIGGVQRKEAIEAVSPTVAFPFIGGF